jgi:ATP-dependent protease ClpP protease subunit
MFDIVAKANSEVEIQMYGTIAQWEKLNATDFVNAVNTAMKSNPKIVVFPIHSPGGNVGEGMPMINKVRELKAKGVKTIARIDGMAASMASVFAACCDETELTPFCRMMVHEGKVGIHGSVKELRNMANLLEGINKDIASIYAEKTGQDEKWILDNWMSEGKDTWFTAQEAIDAKLADRKTGAVVKHLPKVSALNDWSAIAAAYDPFFNDTTQKKMDREQLIKKLGLQANATDAEILAALDTALTATEKKDTTPPPSEKKDDKDLAPVIDGVVALAKERGLSDTQIESVKALAKTDLKAAMAFIPAKAETKPEEKSLSVNELLAALKSSGTGAEASASKERAGWSFSEWSKKDPAGLMAMAKDKPAELSKLYSKEFGMELSAEEIKKLTA